jgi:hypothetical protein
MFSEYGTGERAGDFRGPGLPFLTIAGEYAVLAFNHLHREILEIQFLAAANGCQLGFIDTRAQQEIHSGSGAKDLGPEALGDKWDVTDMISVTMPGEDVVGAVDNFKDRLFVGLPFFRGDRLLAREERIDQDFGLMNLNFPTGSTEPLQGHMLRWRSGAGLGLCSLRSKGDRSDDENDD